MLKIWRKNVMPERYSRDNPVAALGLLTNAMFDGGDDLGAIFPRSDAEDMSRGARFVPGDVTLARRRGERVHFHSNCGKCCWFWEMPDGSRIYHWDPIAYLQLGHDNHGNGWSRDQGPAGPCKSCGNPHTNGGKVTADQVAQTQPD
jgi:hypothetical protein